MPLVQDGDVDDAFVDAPDLGTYPGRRGSMSAKRPAPSSVDGDDNSEHSRSSSRKGVTIGTVTIVEQEGERYVASTDSAAEDSGSHRLSLGGIDESSTVMSEVGETIVEETSEEQVMELEGELARLRFELADARAQSDYYRMQHRQLRVQFDDLKAFCEQLRTENESLRRNNDADKKKGGMWPFQQKEVPKSKAPKSLKQHFADASSSEDEDSTKNPPQDAVLHGDLAYANADPAAFGGFSPDASSRGSRSTYDEKDLEKEKQTHAVSPAHTKPWWAILGAKNAAVISPDEEYDLKDFRHDDDDPKVQESDHGSSLEEELQRKTAMFVGMHMGI